MRTFVFAALLCAVAGCNDDNRRLDALESSNAVLTRMRADITTLKAQVAGLPAPVDTKPLTDRLDALEAAVNALPAPVDTKPLTDRLDALEAKAASTVRAPHLIVDKTGEDLGAVLDLYHHSVWSTKLNAELASVAGRQQLFFDQIDCKGVVAMQLERRGMYANGTDGELYKAPKAPESFSSQSYFDGNNCKNENWNSVLAAVVDTGMQAIVYPPEQLRLELH